MYKPLDTDALKQLVRKLQSIRSWRLQRCNIYIVIPLVPSVGNVACEDIRFILLGF